MMPYRFLQTYIRPVVAGGPPYSNFGSNPARPGGGFQGQPILKAQVHYWLNFTDNALVGFRLFNKLNNVAFGLISLRFNANRMPGSAVVVEPP